MRIHDGRGGANLLSTIHIMKVAGQSPMHVHDVAANLPSTLMKVPSSLLSAFVMQNVDFRMCLAICYPHP
jgi:hypothetical protein